MLKEHLSIVISQSPVYASITISLPNNYSGLTACRTETKKKKKKDITNIMKIVNSLSIAPDVLKQLKSYVYDIIGCCQEVHKELGPWLNEYIYQDALKLSFEEIRPRQRPMRKVLLRCEYQNHFSFLANQAFHGFSFLVL